MIIRSANKNDFMKDSKKLKEKAENIVNDLKKLFPTSKIVESAFTIQLK